MNKWIWGTFGLGTVVTITVIIVNYWPLFCLLIPAHKAEKFEVFQTNNENGQIRVEAFHECCGFVPGAYYTFSFAPINSDNLSEIMTFRHDDPIPIRKNQVQFVSDDIAFVYMGGVFAATHDAGKRWSVWNACKHAEANNICNYEGIKKVELSIDGTGLMTTNPIPDQVPRPLLRTVDFGQSWHE